MNGDVVHAPLSRRLCKGLTVLDRIGVEGKVVGFKVTRTWSGGRPHRTTWVLFETPDKLRSHRLAAELRVVERKAVA